MAPLLHAVHLLPDLTISVVQATDPFDTALFGILEPKLKALADELVWWATTLSGGGALQDGRASGPRPLPALWGCWSGI